MGVIRQPRKVLVHDGMSSDGGESSNTTTDTESVVDSGTVTPVPGSVRPARPGVCPLQVRRGLGAHNLRLKQGRRTKQR